MKNICVILLIMIFTSCKRGKVFEFTHNGSELILIDKSETVKFARESDIDTLSLEKTGEGAYRIIGFSRQKETSNKLSIHINQLKEK